jgi:hypothetical protein
VFVFVVLRVVHPVDGAPTCTPTTPGTPTETPGPGWVVVVVVVLLTSSAWVGIADMIALTDIRVSKIAIFFIFSISRSVASLRVTYKETGQVHAGSTNDLLTACHGPMVFHLPEAEDGAARGRVSSP